jgi:hypothetical protein
MGSGIAAKLLEGGLLLWLALLALLIIVRILRGTIHASGLLAHRLDGAGGAIAPERVVAMITFPFVLGLYTIEALHVDFSGAAGMPSLPDVPQYMLTLLTGGNSIYLAGKIARNT